MIDRNQWGACASCKNGAITIHIPAFRAMAVCNQHMDHGPITYEMHTPFCPICGRPLTEEAWRELEKRLRGERTCVYRDDKGGGKHA